MAKKYKINVRTGKFDMINDGPSSQSIRSQDGSIDVTDTGDGVDLSVPLVTEQRNGLEHSFDKLVRDHSLMNIISVDSSNSYANAKEANQILVDADSEYYPVFGQMIEFVGSDGKLHLYRYNGNYLIRKDGVKEWWCGCTYDFKNNCWLINRNSSGSKMRIARSSSALFWTVTDYPDSSTEKYLMMASASFGSVVMSGNSSREYSFSPDGGDTIWIDKTLSYDKYYQSVKKANVIIDNVEKEVILFIALDITLYLDDNLNNNLFINQKNLLTGIGKTVKQATDVEVTIFNGVQNIFILWNGTDNIRHITWVRNLQEVYTYDFESDEIVWKLQYKDGQLYCCPGDSGNVTRQSKSLILNVDFENDEITAISTYDNTHSIIPTDNGMVRIFNHKQVYVDNTLIELPVLLASDEYLTTVATDGDKRILVVTGGHQYSEQKGNYAFLIDVEKKKVLNNDDWEEVAVITNEFSGIVTSGNAQLKPLDLNEYLEYDKTQRELSAVASDRSSEYQNYRLIGSEIAECWCKVALDDIIDNTTKVYSDEECTEELGTIVQHRYNPNNPLYVIIDVSGTEYVVKFNESKTPVSLATTKALIEAVGDVEDILNEITGVVNAEDIINEING